MYKAALSTVVIPIDGEYRITTLLAGIKPDLTGVPHYVNHPDTKTILESLGAIPVDSKALFEGLGIGEKAICLPIKQGKSTRAQNGFNVAHQNVDFDDLNFRIIERIA